MFDWSKKDGFSEKEKVVLLLKEYDALRAEITAMATGFNQFVALGATVCGAVLTVGLAKADITAFYSDLRSATLAVLPFVAVVAIVIILATIGLRLTWAHVRLLGKQVEEIERRINAYVRDDLVAAGDGCDLLTWETKRSLRQQGASASGAAKS